MSHNIASDPADDELVFASTSSNLQSSTHLNPPPGTSNGGGPSMEPITFVSGAIRSARHPTAAFFHLLFKTGAILAYIFCNWFTDNFTLSFIVCLLLLAFDFWTVKNVTGRLLVGMRWSNIIHEDGSNEWKFESVKDTSTIGAIDYRIFWFGQVVSMISWIVFLVIAFISLKFSWMIIVFVALGLNGANMWGYLQCSRQGTGASKAAAQAKKFGTNVAMSLATQTPGFFGRVSNFFSSSNSNSQQYTPVNNGVNDV